MIRLTPLIEYLNLLLPGIAAFLLNYLLYSTLLLLMVWAITRLLPLRHQHLRDIF